jgi:Uma2 family endonuclease
LITSEEEQAIMPQPTRHALLSVEDYLAREDGADCRHEYIDGRLYAMTGASRAHGLIVGNIHAALHPRVRGTACQLFSNDMKVRLRIAEQEIFYYPDLLLTCDPSDRETYYCTAPCLLIEVLSDSTERIDRREKFLSYQRLSSLEAYWLVAQQERRVEIFLRTHEWRMETVTSGSISVDCLGVELSLDAIYEDVIQAP